MTVCIGPGSERLGLNRELLAHSPPAQLSIAVVRSDFSFTVYMSTTKPETDTTSESSSQDRVTALISGFFQRYGLAFVMVASYFGSGSVFIMSSAGVQFGYAMIWLVGLAVLLGIMAQDMSARVGIFGDSLGQFTRRKFGETGATALLAFVSIGCVLWGLELTAAVGLGTAILVESLVGVSVSWMPIAVIVGVMAAGIGLLRYQYVEYLMTVMMLALLGAFSVVAVASTPAPLSVAAGVVPDGTVFSPGGLTLAAAILGTTALWPNFFLESLFVEEKGWQEPADLADMRLDLGMGYVLGGSHRSLSSSRPPPCSGRPASPNCNRSSRQDAR